VEVVVRHGLNAVACAVGLLLSFVVTAEEPGRQPESARADAAGPGYVVVLTDGAVIPSKSRPLSAFGSFRFVDTTGRTQVLPVSNVDLDATRAANTDVPNDPTRGTLSVAGGAANELPPLPVEGEETAIEEPKPSSITVYSATWCGYCKDLKNYLAARKIPATIIEVDRLPVGEQGTAEANMKRMTGRVSYPTVVINGEAKAGFSPSWIESKLGR